MYARKNDSIIVLITSISPLLVICSLVGAFIIVIGLYSVVWGKSKDEAEKKGKVQELPIVMGGESVESPDTIKSKLQEKTPQEA